MKTLLITLSIGLSMSTLNASKLYAEELVIPKITAPNALDEGTQRVLSPSQISELLPWAKNSKTFLLDLVDNSQNLPMEQRLERLIEGVEQVVQESQSIKSEMIMRYSLNRSLVIYKILEAEMDSSNVGTIDAKVRVLMQSIKMAIAYYDNDVLSLTKNTVTPFAQFGMEYFNFLHELNKSIFDATAQYNIQRTAMEFLQWDLYRDINNTTYASQIIKINNSLKIFPQKNMPDAHAISYIRQMKKIVEQLNLPKQVKNEVEETKNIFSKKEEVVVAPVKTRKVKNYNGNCYATDSSGEILWDAGKLSWSRCHDGRYTTYNGACYAVDLVSSEILWSGGKQSWENCHSGRYRNYNGSCYPTDRSGEILWSAGKVSYTYCQ